ncbi:hypothetical protein [Amycolatopsis sp. NPDC059021]|uniref:hypothetical protein n=1 Tax=Amycolatopsis sp. NPDC059021 TaxID=3346704 RepID=UPI00366AC95D
MDSVSLLAITLLSTLGVTVREMTTLWRYHLRRASIERVVAGVGPGGRVIDREPDGAVIEVSVHSSATAKSEVELLQVRDHRAV